MKRWLAGALALLMLLVICGCGNDTRKEDYENYEDYEENDDRPNKDSRGWLINESRGHFEKMDASPEISAYGPMADVSEAYFTNNGHLCVKMLISNGTDSVLRIDALDVVMTNYETGEVLAGGKAELEEELTIQLAGVEEYTFYIAPEHVLMDEKASLPDLVSFTITIDHTDVEVE